MVKPSNPTDPALSQLREDLPRNCAPCQYCDAATFNAPIEVSIRGGYACDPCSRERLGEAMGRAGQAAAERYHKFIIDAITGGQSGSRHRPRRRY